MRKKLSTYLVAALALTLSAPAFAAPECKKVTGKMSEVAIDEFLQLGPPRVLSVSQGTINSLGTAVLTSLTPLGGGVFNATSLNLFVVNPTNQLKATGAAVFTAIPDTPNVNTVLTLTIAGGTGKFANATGTITATGVGLNLFAPGGKASFEYTLTGEICGAGNP